MNKKIVLNFLLGVLLLLSCDKEEFDDVASAEYNYIGIPTQRVPTSVTEGTEEGGVVDIPLYYTTRSNEDFEITFTVSGSAQLGVDFNVVDAVNTTDDTFTLNISGDQLPTSFKIQAVPNAILNEEVLGFTAEITSLPEGIYTNYPLSGMFALEISDDDCNFIFDEFEGEFQANDFTSNESNGDAYAASITLKSVLGDVYTYTVNNYAGTFFGDGISFDFTVDATNLLDPKVSIPEQEFSAFGFDWVITPVGESSISTCNREITIGTNLVSLDGTYNIDWEILYQ